MKCRFLLLVLLSSSLILNAQNPSINWDKTLGGALGESSASIIKIPNSENHLLIGNSPSGISGEKTEESYGGFDIWVVEVAEEGEFVSDKTIGGSDHDNLSDVLVINDRIYMLCSSLSPESGLKTSPNFGDRDYWLVCMNFEGEVLWDYSYGGTEKDHGSSILQLDNGNLLLIGSSESGVSGNKTAENLGFDDIWLVTVNSDNGEIINQKTIGTSSNEGVGQPLKLPNGDILLTSSALTGVDGDKTDEGYGNSDVWLVRIDQELNILQDKCIGGDDQDSAAGSIFYDNGFIYFNSKSWSGPSGLKESEHYGWGDYWIVKLDMDLNLVAEQTYGGGYHEYLGSINKVLGDKIAIFGTSLSVGGTGNRTVDRYGEGDIWMIITDLDLEEVTQESYGGSGLDLGANCLEKADGNLLISGSSNSDVSGVKTEDSRGEWDYWILNLDASTYLSVEDFKETAFQISTYPNPFSSTIQFDLSEVDEPQQLIIYSSAGKLVHRQKFNNAQRYTWQPPNAEAGIYFYVLNCEDAVVRGKIVKK